MTTATSLVGRTVAERTWVSELRELLKETVSGVESGDRSNAAVLAEWRRGLGKEPMTAPGMWKHIVRVADRAHDRERDRVEEAVHHALALYATHQQSRSEAMHVDDEVSLGAACRRLAGGHDDENPGVRRRFYAAATADTADELAYHLRGLVTLLRGERIPLDYARLAWEIARWHNASSRSAVRRAWARDFEAQGRSGGTGDDSPTADRQSDDDQEG